MGASGVTAPFESQTFEVARYCVRRRSKDSALQGGDRPALTMLQDRRLGRAGGGMGLTPFLGGEVTKDGELVTREPTTESGGHSPDASAEPALASPRLIPNPESPENSEGPSFLPELEDLGQPSNSFDKQCAPSQAPTMEGSQYDHLPYDALHNLCKSRGYCKKDAKTVLKTRLGAMDKVGRNSPQVQSGNMDTSFSALGKRARSRSVSHILETPTKLSVGKRARGEPVATNMAVDLAVVNTHAQRRSSDLKL